MSEFEKIWCSSYMEICRRCGSKIHFRDIRQRPRSYSPWSLVTRSAWDWQRHHQNSSSSSRFSLSIEINGAAPATHLFCVVPMKRQMMLGLPWLESTNPTIYWRMNCHPSFLLVDRLVPFTVRFILLTTFFLNYTRLYFLKSICWLCNQITTSHRDLISRLLVAPN